MKLSIFKELKIMNIEDFVRDEIADIRLVGEMETVDITVEDTHMFYANEIYTHNSSIQDEIIEADKISESYSKIMTADLVISLSRKLEDKANHTGRAHIIKNRFGADGVTLPVYMNTNVGKIEIYDENSSKGILLKKQMQSSEGMMKKALSKKLQEMNGMFDGE
jgi:hypothetical protein